MVVLNGSSIVFCFEFALIEEMVKKKLISKKSIIKNYHKIRKYVPHAALASDAEKQVIKFLGLSKEEL